MDLIWRKKLFGFLGAGLFAVSLAVMYGLIIHTSHGEIYLLRLGL